MKITDRSNWITFLTALLTAALLIMPMGLSPVWNGEIANHHNQYEEFGYTQLNQ